MNMNFIRSAAAALALAALSTGAMAGSDEWQRADAEYEAQHFAAALVIYERLAMAGDARAAELAGHMHALGEKLYGDSVRRDPVRASRWLHQATDAGRPVAAHLLRNVRPGSAIPVASK